MGRAGACVARLHGRDVLFNAVARKLHGVQWTAI
jgi:hypothetical protein